MTPDEIKTQYRRARRAVDRKAKFTALECPQKTCRYCGRFWLQWKGSKLDGHAACVVDLLFKHTLRVVFIDPTVTYDQVAKVLGVTPSVVRSWTFPIRSTHRRTA